MKRLMYAGTVAFIHFSPLDEFGLSTSRLNFFLVIKTKFDSLNFQPNLNFKASSICMQCWQRGRGGKSVVFTMTLIA